MRVFALVMSTFLLMACTGSKGEPGTDGASGPEGNQGGRGETGARGERGEPGQPGATGDSGPQGPQGPQGDAGPAGPQGPQGDAGPPGPRAEAGAGGGVVFKDATGKTLPLAYLFGGYVYFDAQGIVWNFDVVTGTLKAPTNSVANVGFKSSDCTGDAFIYPAAAPRVVWGSFLDGPYRVLTDTAKGEVINACSFYYDNAPTTCVTIPQPCANGFTYRFADTIKVTEPDVSSIVLPIHPEYAP